ncbi:hypothetical protein SAMN03159476_00375 [Pseudomonas sp. NFPP05]|uniref:hypothetical protein n=1 Tax=unclassified Pseudomonas TaxID=196821 RepID=UPI00088592F0|nr:MULTISPECIES: hypothetical protein [unclassified Pseudomonas]SDA11093.1 hypothetical protein SAMN03159465_00375 [Pseudomonas sp. NFPP12]SFM12017.1 hypothetical protein SAMN03159476_00375 [Pseudomonas sp. NFPP05]
MEVIGLLLIFGIIYFEMRRVAPLRERIKELEDERHADKIELADMQRSYDRLSAENERLLSEMAAMKDQYLGELGYPYSPND